MVGAQKDIVQRDSTFFYVSRAPKFEVDERLVYLSSERVLEVFLKKKKGVRVHSFGYLSLPVELLCSSNWIGS